MTLNQTQINEYLKGHLPYRLNSLRAWDIYISRRKAKVFVNEDDKLKCYWESELLQPSFEISIVFGRSLLNFLGIKIKGGILQNFEFDGLNQNEADSIFIWHVNPGKRSYPISNIKASDLEHLFNLISVANKSAAHLTIKTSTIQEQDSIQPARQIIYRLMLEYVEGLEVQNIWWYPRQP